MEQKKSRNWWMIAFFVVLLVAEFERELLVVDTDDSKMIVGKNMYTFGDRTFAEGQWVRADGGGKLTPQAVHIDCRRSEGTCDVASYQLYNGYGYRPELDHFDADFGKDSITMSAKGDCVTSVTRLDLATEEVVQTRVKTKGWRDNFAKTPEMEKGCAMMEDKLVARLSGWDDPALENDPLKGHFVPMLSFLAWVF